MIISGSGITTITASIMGHAPKYEQGIEWFMVGGVRHSIDRGAESGLWSSEVTILDSQDVTGSNREQLVKAVKNGTAVSIQCEAWEQVFGPEFDYSLPFECVLGANENSYSQDTGRNGVLGVWKFTARIINAPWDRLKYLNYATNPDGQLLQSIDRSKNFQAVDLNAEFSYKSHGFEWDGPTAVLKYIADSETTAKAIGFYTGLRSLPFILTQGVSIFTQGVYTESCNVLGVNHIGPIDMANNYYEYDLIIGRA